MHTKAFQFILTILALLGTVHGRVTPTTECTAKAWVRAPDLTPNTIVRGDARVKISAECPTVESVSLGLRFKERSFIKALRSREDVKWLNPEYLAPPRFTFPTVSSPWSSIPPRFANKSVEENHEEITTNKNLWVVREEERLIFETTQPINMQNRDHGVLRDAVQDISILVPSTNFPPSPDIMANGIQSYINQEIMFGEWIYEYFAQISFSNGTTREIPAGFTAFQPLYGPVYNPQEFVSATLALKSFDHGYMAESTTENLAANYSIEISDELGLILSAGTKKHVNATITRTGIARTFSQPLSVFPCVKSTSSSRWAAEYGVPTFDEGANAIMTSFSSAFRTTPGGGRPADPLGRCFFRSNLEIAVMMPNSTLEEIQANTIVTTTSVPFTMTVDVDEAHIPTFETHYQALTNSFTITLQVPREEKKDVDPDDLSSVVSDCGPHFEEDEESWVPWEKERITRPFWGRRTYTGSVPVMVLPTWEGTALQHCLHASLNMPGEVVLPDGAGCQRSSIHYLDEGARGPTFVDPSVVHELLAQDPAERELRAPILQPMVSSPPEGEELIYRYYLTDGPHPHGHQLLYVGNTWTKKVANKNGVSSMG